MAVSVKVAKTDPMPLKLQVEVLSKENPKVFKQVKLRFYKCLPH